MRKLAIFSFSFALSIAVYVYCGAPIFLAMIGGGLFLLALGLLIFSKARKIVVCGIVLLGLGFGITYAHGYDHLRLQSAKSLAGITQELTFTAIAQPQKSNYGYQLTCQLDNELNHTRVLLYYSDALSVSLGDRITVLAEIRDSQKTSSGDSFLYYQTKDISLVCIARDEPEVQKTSSLPIRLYPAKLAEQIRVSITSTFSPQTAGFMQALLTGDRSDLSDTEKSDLAGSGISHVIAISGMHVSILLAVVYQLCGYRRRLAALIGIPFVLLFAEMIGFTPSVVRAAIMQIFFLLAPIFHQENDTPTALGASLLLILLINPWAISSLSLQLSYCSVIGILLFAQPIYRWMAPCKKENPKHLFLWPLYKLLQYICLSVATTLAASVFTTPVLLLTLGSIPLLSVLTNTLVLWAISICFVVGFLAIILSFFWSNGAGLLAVPIGYLVRYILFAAEFVAKIPYSSVSTGNRYFLYWLGFAYIIFIVHLCRRKKRKKLLFTCTMLSSMLLFIVLTVCQPVPNARVTSMDVGQGQCLLFQSKSYCAMVDCGGSDAIDCATAAAKQLQNSGQLSLDCVIVSHYDADHVCGLPQLLRQIRVDKLYLPKVADESGWRETIEALAVKYAIPIEYINTSVCISLPTGKLTVMPPMLQDTSNSSSLSVLFQTEQLCAFTTGDMDLDAEQMLLRRYALPQVDVLIAGHHGSKHSTSDRLIRRTCPKYVWISVGKNSYGHPSEEALSRIRKCGAVIYRTDECGTLMIER